jgi:hypothetical protein
MKGFLKFLGALLCCASSAYAIEDEGVLQNLKRVTFPMFAVGGTEISCIGYYAMPPTKGHALAVIVTAGHCGDRVFPRSDDGSPVRLIGYSKTFSAVYDEQVLHRPDCGHAFPKGFTVPVVDEVYYSLGHRKSSDTFTELQLVRMHFVRNDPERGLVFRRECTGDECAVNMLPGVSGSPIVTKEGSVVATYKGFRASRPQELLGSPTDVLNILVPSIAKTTVPDSGTSQCSARNTKEPS